MASCSLGFEQLFFFVCISDCFSRLKCPLRNHVKAILFEISVFYFCLFSWISLRIIFFLFIFIMLKNVTINRCVNILMIINLAQAIFFLWTVILQNLGGHGFFFNILLNSLYHYLHCQTEVCTVLSLLPFLFLHVYVFFLI